MKHKLARRRLLGGTLAATGAILTGAGFARGETLTTKGRIMLDSYSPLSHGLVEAATFPLVEAIHGRRSRRFAKGASIPNGPLAYSSQQAPEPLNPTEQMLLISTVAGNTGWANLFSHHPGYADQLPNYTTAAGGRSFPSSAGFNLRQASPGTGDENRKEVRDDLKPFAAIQRVRLPPGKGAARQPEASLAWPTATVVVKRRQRVMKRRG